MQTRKSLAIVLLALSLNNDTLYVGTSDINDSNYRSFLIALNAKTLGVKNQTGLWVPGLPHERGEVLRGAHDALPSRSAAWRGAHRSRARSAGW